MNEAESLFYLRLCVWYKVHGGDFRQGYHDFEGPRSPKAQLNTVLRNLSSHLGRPRTRNETLIAHASLSS